MRQGRQPRDHLTAKLQPRIRCHTRDKPIKGFHQEYGLQKSIRQNRSQYVAASKAAISQRKWGRETCPGSLHPLELNSLHARAMARVIPCSQRSSQHPRRTREELPHQHLERKQAARARRGGHFEFSDCWCSVGVSIRPYYGG